MINDVRYKQIEPNNLYFKQIKHVNFVHCTGILSGAPEHPASFLVNIPSCFDIIIIVELDKCTFSLNEQHPKCQIFH